MRRTKMRRCVRAIRSLLHDSCKMDTATRQWSAVGRARGKQITIEMAGNVRSRDDIRYVIQTLLSLCSVSGVTFARQNRCRFNWVTIIINSYKLLGRFRFCRERMKKVLT